MKMLKRKDIKAYKTQEIKVKGNLCPVLKVSLEVSNTVLDHDHTTGYCRQVIDRNLNQLLGKIESNYKRFIGVKMQLNNPLPHLLRNLADYIEKDYSRNPLHPSWIDLEIRRFGRENKAVQETALKANGITPGKTSKERTKQFRKWRYNG